MIKLSQPIASAAAGLNLLVHSVVIGHNPHSNSDGYLTNHPASYAGWCGVRPGLKDIRTGQGLWIVVVIWGGGSMQLHIADIFDDNVKQIDSLLF
jgi:hypothetical protein